MKNKIDLGSLVEKYNETKKQIKELETKQEYLKQLILLHSKEQKYTINRFSVSITDKNQIKINSGECTRILNDKKLLQQFQIKALDEARIRENKGLFTEEEQQLVFITNNYKQLTIKELEQIIEEQK